jgi:hypothetical protein
MKRLLTILILVAVALGLGSGAGYLAAQTGVPVYGSDPVLVGAYAINVPTTSCLLTDPNVGAVVLPWDTIKIGILYRNGATANIYWRLGAAATLMGPQWNNPGMDLPITATKAGTMTIIGDSNQIATVLVFATRS